MAREIPMSRCPFCKALGVRQYEPLVIDGYPRDVPYCGKCGRNYPVEQQPTDNVTPFPRSDR